MLNDLLADCDRWPVEPEGWVFSPVALEVFFRAFDGAHFVKPDPHGDGSVVWFNSIDHVPLFDAARESQTEQELEDRDRAARAVNYVSARIGQAAFAGRLKTAARLKTGGGLIPLEPEVWGIDDYWPRLRICALSPLEPFNLGDTSHWLFFEERSLWWEVDSVRIELGMQPRWQRRNTLLVDPLEWPGPDREEAEERNRAGSLEAFHASKEAPCPRVPKSLAGRRADKASWSAFSAALARYACEEGLDPHASAASIFAAVDQFLGDRGRPQMSEDSVRDTITMAQAWVRGERIDGDSPEGG